MFKKILSSINIFSFLGKIKHLRIMDIPRAIITFLLNRIAGTKTWFLLRFLSRIVIDGTEYDISGSDGKEYEAETRTGGKVKFTKKDIKDAVKSALKKQAEPITLLDELVNLTDIKVNISKDINISNGEDLVRTSGKFLKLVFSSEDESKDTKE